VVTGADLVGRIGSVTTRVRGGERPGEVKVVVGGLAHYYLAFCRDVLPVGAQVLVIGVRQGRQVDVEPWEQWARSATDGAGPTEAM
jgi:hypothetical protein